MLEIAAKGFIIGLLVSSPMGPINMLTIQRTLNRGRWHGFVTGMGAMLSDISYALITMVGLSFISEFLSENKKILQIAGSIILVLFGIGVFRSNPLKVWTPSYLPENTRYVKDFFSSFVLTFSNIAIVFVLIGLYTRFSFNPFYEGFHVVIAGIAGFITAALLWWFFITTLVSRLRKKFKRNGLLVLNRVIGGVFVIIGLVGIVLSA
ncbi:MAG: LysE family transporter [Fermentimonas sp.]|jgi:threonine/homoserine/homoserine lactone efflux protein|nr:LysE family transporter [Fermentimonas sp.]NLC86772.1 LysE family transporter [Bacteroidales bacterium]HBT85898.1 lysine transporter LysE [Porphyromonadaceae bacterium]MDD2930091.1 LysE family transporter [Fermentimonas sp.]MDD3187948.1 LysE family transporter [Fermentimonas sp.]